MSLPSLIVIDDFYSDPDEVLKTANALQFAKSPVTNYPGERSGDLQEVAPKIYAEWREKFLELYGRFNPQGNWQFSTQFQRIYAPKPGASAPNEGWVNRDPAFVAGVIYLNKDFIPNRGTTLVQPKRYNPDPNANLAFRNAYYGGRNKITDEDYAAALAKNNSRFDDSVKIESRLNRFIAFDCRVPHKQAGFGAADEPRLTQIFFAYIIKDQL